MVQYFFLCTEIRHAFLSFLQQKRAYFHISFFFWYHLASRQDDKAFISIGGLQRGSSIPLLSPCISTSFFGMKIWKWITSTQEGIVLHESNLLNLSLPSSKQWTNKRKMYRNVEFYQSSVHWIFFLKSKKLKYLLQIGEICEEIVPYTNVLPQKSSIDRNLCTNLANALFPFRYLNIVKSEGLEISQPGLDSKLSEIHHRITVRKKSGSFHR